MQKIIMNQEQIMEMVLDHHENPRNYGEIDDASVVQESGNPGCGDILRVYLKIDTNEIVEEIRFSGEGCMLSQAGASIVLEGMRGKTAEEIDSIPAGIVLEKLGKKLVSTRPDCARLGFNTLKKALKKWQNNQILSET